MYGNYLYWESEYNASPLSVDLGQDSIVFDSYSLQNASIITTKADWDDEGRIDLNSFDYPKSDGGGVISKFYRGRVINVEVTLKADTAEDLQTLLDTFKKKLRTTEGYLDIIPAGLTEIRRIKATVTSLKFGREYYHITFISKVKIQFTALEPFFYAKTKQSYEFLSNTASFAGEITNEGSTDSLPVFYLIGTTSCNIASTTFTAFGRSLTIPSTIVVGDVLIIDSETKSVTLNGVDVDYTGYFPVFPAWSNPFTFTFSGTVRTDVTIVQNKNYL